MRKNYRGSAGRHGSRRPIRHRHPLGNRFGNEIRGWAKIPIKFAYAIQFGLVCPRYNLYVQEEKRDSTNAWARQDELMEYLAWSHAATSCNAICINPAISSCASKNRAVAGITQNPRILVTFSCRNKCTMTSCGVFEAPSKDKRKTKQTPVCGKVIETSQELSGGTT